MLKKSGLRLSALLLIIGISVFLSGCLVKKKDPSEIETIARTTDYWRVYQAGDWIEYDLQEVDTNTVTTTLGVLRVDWGPVVFLTDPTDSNIIYQALKETTSITYDGNNGSDPDVAIIRYISQINETPADSNQGRIFLHAIDDGTDKYWPYASGTVFPTSNPASAPVLFDSPMAIGVPPENDDKAFSIAQCDIGQCNPEIYRYHDISIEIVGDTTSVENTPLGNFSNPFQINFGGSSIPQNAEALTFVGDIRDVCGDISDTILHGNNVNVGRFFVFPEIGIIKMENSCQVGADIILYTATIRGTNINFQ